MTRQLDMRHFLEWTEDFSLKDDGVEAYVAIMKLREISSVMAMKSEGWEDDVRAILAA